MWLPGRLRSGKLSFTHKFSWIFIRRVSMLITQGEKAVTTPLRYALNVVHYRHEFTEQHHCQWEQRV